MKLTLDDGYQFGLGAFETICLYRQMPLLLDWHLERLHNTLRFLQIDTQISRAQVMDWLAASDPMSLPELAALKIMVSQENITFTVRDNPYTDEKRKAGFRLGYSPILRNETSPFTYHKTMNYGINILEKRRTHDLAIDEVLFVNTRGEICEGSTTNVFFVSENTLYTPKLSCGLLPGVLRRYLLETYSVRECILHPEDILQMEECFVTNSLMGIMPVLSLETQVFPSRKLTETLAKEYDVRHLISRQLL